MSVERIQTWMAEYQRALARLRSAAMEDLSRSDVVIDGTIQRFEFTFELAWKMMKAALEHQGISVQSPRAAIKEAFKIDWIQDGDGWIDLLGDRNKTSHLYDEAQALDVYRKIKDRHLALFDQLSRRMAAWMAETD